MRSKAFRHRESHAGHHAKPHSKEKYLSFPCLTCCCAWMRPPSSSVPGCAAPRRRGHSPAGHPSEQTPRAHSAAQPATDAGRCSDMNPACSCMPADTGTNSAQHLVAAWLPNLFKGCENTNKPTANLWLVMHVMHPQYSRPYLQHSIDCQVVDLQLHAHAAVRPGEAHLQCKCKPRDATYTCPATLYCSSSMHILNDVVVRFRSDQQGGLRRKSIAAFV